MFGIGCIANRLCSNQITQNELNNFRIFLDLFIYCLTNIQIQHTNFFRSLLTIHTCEWQQFYTIYLSNASFDCRPLIVTELTVVTFKGHVFKYISRFVYFAYVSSKDSKNKQKWSIVYLWFCYLQNLSFWKVKKKWTHLMEHVWMQHNRQKDLNRTKLLWLLLN